MIAFPTPLNVYSDFLLKASLADDGVQTGAKIMTQAIANRHFSRIRQQITLLKGKGPYEPENASATGPISLPADRSPQFRHLRHHAVHIREAGPDLS